MQDVVLEFEGAVAAQAVGGEGFDFALECVGHPATIRGAYDAARRGGKAVIVGVGRIEILDHDTCAEDEWFFSFRRSTLRGEERFGLQISGIVLDT